MEDWEEAEVWHKQPGASLGQGSLERRPEPDPHGPPLAHAGGRSRTLPANGPAARLREEGFVLIALPHHGLRAASSASKIQQSYRFTASLVTIPICPGINTVFLIVLAS